LKNAIPDSSFRQRREFAPGDERSDDVAFCDGKQKVRWMLGVVMHRYFGGGPSRNMASANHFKIIFRHVIVGALDLDSDPLAGFEQDAVGTDFDIEFVDLIWFQRLFLHGMSGAEIILSA
jgi:hypothetical protein